jgi:GNAT superfamily N-acetyltransferase
VSAIKYSGSGFSAAAFLALAQRVWPREYDAAIVTEILVDPDYQRRGIGRELMARALASVPRGKLFFGAQPQSVGFFDKLGCERGPVGMVMRHAV